MSYDRIIRDALRLARAPRRFASGGNAPLGVDHPDYQKNLKNFMSRSVLKDESGKPIRLYHGTSADVAFKRFKKSDRGIWLTENPKEASSYAELNDSMGYKTISTPKELSYERTNTASRVIPVHANITNPYKLTDEDRRNMRTAKSYQSVQSNLFNKARALGHDGVDMGDGVWVAFEPEQVKSAIGNVGTFDPAKKEFGYASGGDVDQPRKLDDMGFYSSAAESARSLPQSKGTPQQMLATMKGVKPAELEWSGVQDKFAGQKSVTKDDLAQHFEQNVPEIKETVLGGKIDPEILKRRNEIKNIYSGKINEYLSIAYDSAESPESREEALVKAEEIQDKMWDHMDREATLPNLKSTKYQEYTVGSSHKDGSPSQRNYREVLLHLPGEEKFQSSHWDPANIVAHLRMQDRGPNNNILHLEELQSDWAQEGREEGFRDESVIKQYKDKIKELKNRIIEDGIGGFESARDEAQAWIKNLRDSDLIDFFPEEAKSIRTLSEKKLNEEDKIQKAPYVTNTDHWVELGLKRALLEAARGGYDKLVWTPGEEQAKRYDLSRHVAKILYNPEQRRLEYIKVGDRYEIPNEHPEHVLPEELPRVIGREAADKLLATNKDKYGTHSLGGLDLKIGGEGMKSFYDKMLPSALRRVLKPHTDKIQPTSYVVKGNDGEDVTLPGIEITPELRESILKRGFSYYARGGEVRQHFEVGGGAAGGDSDSSGGGFGDSGSGGDSAPEATQDSPAFSTTPAFSTEAPTDYSPPESDPSMLGGATGMAFSPPGSGSLGVGTGNTSGSFLGTAEQQLNTGPGIVGAIAPQPFGVLATIAEAINNAYYGGTARADVDQNAGGAGTNEQPQFKQTPIYDVQQNPVVSKSLDMTAPKEQFTINESMTKPSIVEAPVAAPAPAPALAPTPQPFPTAAPELEEPAPILPEPQPTPALATVPPVIYPSGADGTDGGTGPLFTKADEEDPQKLIQAFSVGKPKLPPMMARGGVPRNSHPALSIPGVHIREEIHGRPIFLGERDG